MTALFKAGTEPRIRYYKRNGKPYTGEDLVLQWGRDMEDSKKKIVKQTQLKNGAYISTVWLGLDHQFGSGKPLIFESMVFWKGHSELEMRRYSTEHQAIYNHNRMVKEWAGLRGVWRVVSFIFREAAWDLKYKLRDLTR